MSLSVAAFAVLTSAALVLAAEVRYGPVARWGRTGRRVAIAVFGGAAVTGTALLTALAGGEWVLAAALVPLTALSAVRFSTLAVPGALGATRAAVLVAVLVVGVVGALAAVPFPLTRGHLAPSAVDAASGPDTIRPYVGRPVRG